jgi:branched-chain amino acid transport system permease protein
MARGTLNGPVVLTALVLLFGLISGAQGDLLQGAVALTYALAATGLGVALGLGGEYLLGQGAIFACGAYVTASLQAVHSWTFWPAAGAGIVAAVLLGFLLSIPALRVSRFYFAMVGFFLVYLIPEIVQLFSAQTGGSAGLALPNAPTFFGITLDNRGMYIFAAIALGIGLLLIRNVRRSPLGVHMRRMRDHPFVIATAGIDVWRVRLAIYTYSSLLAGLAGAIYSQLNGYISPLDFSVDTTILLFAAVLVGGRTTLLGPTLGVFLLYVIPQIVINVASYSDLIYGGTVLFCVIVLPEGVEDAAIGLYRRVRPHRPLPASSVLAGHGEPSAERLAELLWQLRDGTTRTDPLVIRGARKAFGGVAALQIDDEVAVTVEPGQVHLLLGPNGSGKTTLLNAMCGLARLDAGSIHIGDAEVTRAPIARIARRGVGRSFQTPRLPDELLPRQLLGGMLAGMRRVSYLHWLTSDHVAARTRRAADGLADEIVAASGMGGGADRPAIDLTSGERRLLDVLAALTSQAHLILLDEPASGLSAHERRLLAGTIRALAARGMGFLVVEHDLDLALGMADTVTVLVGGTVAVTGQPSEIKEHPYLREVLIGVPA